MKYFGTDGFRGEAGNILTSFHAYKIGRYLGFHFSKGHRGRIVIGKDTRRSSYTLEYALVAGITASGSDAFLLHVTTTPSVSYVARTEGFDCGVMISASHNPYYDNGIKLLDSDGRKMGDSLLEKIEEYIDTPGDDLPFKTGEDIGTASDHAIGRNRYIGYLISLATRSYSNMRIGLDSANGSAFSIAKNVFDSLGAKTYVIGAEPNGLNINDNVGSTHIERLKKLVTENELDCGFAFDGDADRCLAVDRNGNIVDGDHIVYICGRYLKKHGKLDGNHVVVTVMSNLGLFKALDRNGIEYDVTTVGDRYVNEDMTEKGYCLGGEQSGHIIFSKYANTGDGILTALMLMEVILEEKTDLSELSSGMTKFPQLLSNVRVADQDAVLNAPLVKEVADKVTKALGKEGRLLLRKSGTEPLIRVMVEAETDELCERYVREVTDAIDNVI